MGVNALENQCTLLGFLAGDIKVKDWGDGWGTMFYNKKVIVGRNTPEQREIDKSFAWNISIPKFLINYHVKRLVKGALVQVTGALDVWDAKDQVTGAKFQKGMIRVEHIRVLLTGKGGGGNGGSGGGNSVWNSPELQYPAEPSEGAGAEEMAEYEEKYNRVKRKRMELGRQQSEEKQRREGSKEQTEFYKDPSLRFPDKPAANATDDEIMAYQREVQEVVKRRESVSLQALKRKEEGRLESLQRDSVSAVRKEEEYKQFIADGKEHEAQVGEAISDSKALMARWAKENPEKAASMKQDYLNHIRKEASKEEEVPF